MRRAPSIVVAMLVCSSAAADTLTLSPAVVPLGGRPGQSTHQQITLYNDTSQALRFALVAKDVVVRNGVREFVPAGDISTSIAATAVFSASAITVAPHDQRSVEVTVTLPLRVAHRAVIILFQSTTPIGRNATVSLGSLLTFELSGQRSIHVDALQATAATPSANTSFAIPVSADGSEPAIVRGVAVVVGAKGAVVAKVALDTRRLLPGERTVLRADYPGELARGNYRVIATIETAKRSWTRTAVLEVP